MKDLKVIFMGTPEFAVSILDVLNKNTNVVLLVTQEDKRRGRSKKDLYSETKKYALENEIEIFQPHNIKNDYEKILELKPDLIVTAAYGQIIPKELLELPKYGAINVHASLLPKYRGASPIQKAIEEAEDELGVTIMYMDEGMDTGDIISQDKIELEKFDNLSTMTKKLAILSKDLLIKTIGDIINGRAKRIKQDDSKATYSRMIKKEDLKIDFNLKEKELSYKIRSLSYKPGMYTYLDNIKYKLFTTDYEEEKHNYQNGEIVEIDDYMKIAVKDGFIKVYEIQKASKNRMSIKAFFNGNQKSDYLNKVFGDNNE